MHLMKICFIILFSVVIGFGCNETHDPDGDGEHKKSIIGDKALQEKWNIVKSKLHSLNPEWSGQYELESRTTGDGAELKLDLSNKDIERENNVVGITHYPCNLKDISPLSNLTSLRKLVLAETKVQDISPLSKLKLEYLNLCGTNVQNLEPLRGMPLRRLYLSRTPVNDISALSNSQELNRLLVDNTKVESLSALKGIQLIFLDISGTPASKDPLPDDLEVKHLINRTK